MAADSVAGFVASLGSVSYSVQVDACFALAGLAVKDERSATAVRNGGAIAPLIASLSSPRENVQEAAAYAICNLCLYDNNREAVRYAGGLAPMIDLISHRTETVQVQALSGLANLTLNAANVESACVLGLLPPLLKIVAKTDHPAFSQAIKILINIATFPKHVAGIRDAGGIGVLFKLFPGASDAVRVQVACIMGLLAADTDNVEHIARIGAIPYLVDMLGSEIMPVQQAGAQALHQLATTSAARQAIIDARALVQLLALMNVTVQPQDETARYVGVMSNVCRVVLRLMEHPGVMAVLRAYGGIVAILNMLYKANERLQEIALDMVLTTLNDVDSVLVMCIPECRIQVATLLGSRVDNVRVLALTVTEKIIAIGQDFKEVQLIGGLEACLSHPDALIVERLLKILELLAKDDVLLAAMTIHEKLQSTLSNLGISTSLPIPVQKMARELDAKLASIKIATAEMQSIASHRALSQRTSRGVSRQISDDHTGARDAMIAARGAKTLGVLSEEPAAPAAPVKKPLRYGPNDLDAALLELRTATGLLDAHHFLPTGVSPEAVRLRSMARRATLGTMRPSENTQDRVVQLRDSTMLLRELMLKITPQAGSEKFFSAVSSPMISRQPSGAAPPVTTATTFTSHPANGAAVGSPATKPRTSSLASPPVTPRNNKSGAAQLSPRTPATPSAGAGGVDDSYVASLDQIMGVIQPHAAGATANGASPPKGKSGGTATTTTTTTTTTTATSVAAAGGASPAKSTPSQPGAGTPATVSTPSSSPAKHDAAEVKTAAKRDPAVATKPPTESPSKASELPHKSAKPVKHDKPATTTAVVEGKPPVVAAASTTSSSVTTPAAPAAPVAPAPAPAPAPTLAPVDTAKGLTRAESTEKGTAFKSPSGGKLASPTAKSGSANATPLPPPVQVPTPPKTATTALRIVEPASPDVTDEALDAILDEFDAPPRPAATVTVAPINGHGDGRALATSDSPAGSPRGFGMPSAVFLSPVTMSESAIGAATIDTSGVWAPEDDGHKHGPQTDEEYASAIDEMLKNSFDMRGLEPAPIISSTPLKPGPAAAPASSLAPSRVTVAATPKGAAVNRAMAVTPNTQKQFDDLDDLMAAIESDF